MAGGRALLWTLVVAMSGCGYDTPIYGMYFPSWVVAPAVGAALAAVSLSVAARSRIAVYLPSGVVLFSALTLIYAVLLWGLFFDA